MNLLLPRNRKASAVPIVLLLLIALALAASFFLLTDSALFGDSSLRRTILFIVGATVAVVILVIAWEFSTANRLRRDLKKIIPLIDYEPAEIVKKPYLDLYTLYLKLSEKKKQNFYTRVNSLRERIEEHLKNENDIKRLFQQADTGDIAEQKKTYLEIYRVYEKLPRKVQHEYYPRIVQLRDRLERGN